MYQGKDGDAHVQRQIEEDIFKLLKEEFGAADLERNKVLPLPCDSAVKIQPDFYSQSQKIIGEIHSHLGKLKPAQKHKVAADILKLHLFDPENEYLKYYVVCDTEEEKLLKGNSYLAAARKAFGIEVRYIDIGAERRTDLREAMDKQNMFPG